MPRLVDYAARWDLLRNTLERLIHEQGVRGLSVTAVAREAGLSPATLRRLSPTLAGLQGSVWLAASRRVAGRAMLTRPEPGADVRTRVSEAVARYLPGNEGHRRDLRVMRLLEVLAETDGALTAEMRLEWYEHRVSGIRQLLHHLGVEADSAVIHTAALVLGLTDLVLQGRIRDEVARDVLDHHLASLAHPT